MLDFLTSGCYKIILFLSFLIAILNKIAYDFGFGIKEGFDKEIGSDIRFVI